MCHYHLPLPVISATLSQFHSERSVVYHVDGQQGAKSHTVSTSSQQLSLFSSQQTITDDRRGVCVSPSQTAPFVLCLQPEVTGADTCLQTAALKMFVGDKSSSGSTVKWQTAERLEGQESGTSCLATGARQEAPLQTWRLYSCERVFTSSSLKQAGLLRVMWSAF